MKKKRPRASPEGGTEPSAAGLDAGLRAMFDQMLEGIQLIDEDFRYRYVNEIAARHGHRGREELVGRRMTELFPGIEQTEMFGRLTTCMRDRAPQRMLNQFTYPDGAVGWFDLHMAPVPAGVLILSVDVTEQKLAEQDLRRLVQALEQADRRKSELLAMLAHELRNPLAPIQTGLHVLRARATSSDEATAQVIDMMERQVRHLARFVDDLLDVNRIIHGKLTLQSERLDLVRVIRSAVADHAADFKEGGITLRLELPETPVWVDGDQARLAQVLASLLDNACKFTPGAGDVAVRLDAAENGAAAITVRDTGIGMNADALAHVFEPLFQADTSLERTRGGLGLGLSVSKGLVELHGGSIAAASEGAGRGTTIRVELPRAPEPAALAPAVIPAQAAPRQKRVLVIEDNPDAAKTLAMILGVWGYDVGLANSGQAGVDHARANRPDIVLCDIGLPGMDGYDVARALRKDEGTRRAKMIAITGYGRDDDRERALDAGFDLHLAKPVNPDFLRTQLDVAPTDR